MSYVSLLWSEAGWGFIAESINIGLRWSRNPLWTTKETAAAPLKSYYRNRITLSEEEAAGIAFILDGKIMAASIWLEGSWRSFNLQEICSDRSASYFQLGFSFYVGNSV